MTEQLQQYTTKHISRSPYSYCAGTKVTWELTETKDEMWLPKNNNHNNNILINDYIVIVIAS